MIWHKAPVWPLHAQSRVSVRLNLITDIADNKRLAVRCPAFFAMKALRDTYICTIGAQSLAAIRTFFPVASTFLAAIGTLKDDDEFHRVSHWVSHGVSLRPAVPNTYSMDLHAEF